MQGESMKKIVSLIIILSSSLVFAGTPKKAAKPAGPKQGKFTLERYEHSMFTKEIEQKQRQMAHLRAQMINKLQKLLNSPYYKNKAEISFRLAEAYWQEAKWKNMQAMKAYNKAMDAYQTGTLKKKPKEPVADYSTALEYYRKVLRYDPNYYRIAEVMYYLGRGALQEAKAKKDPALRKEGIKQLKDLVQRFPKSRFVSRAYLSLAETYFNHSQFYFAKANYEQILNFPNSPMFNYALYKLGWVYFNLAMYDKTIKTFQKVVAAVSKQSSKVEFRSQALNDLVVTYAEIEHGWDRAKDYFFSIMPAQKAWKKMHALAELYVGKDMVPEAIRAYREFIKHEKTTPAVLSYYKTIVSLHRNVNDYEGSDKLLKEVLQFFDRKGKWWAANSSHPDVLKEADKFLENHILWIATYFHTKAQKKKRTELYLKAANWYKKYLERFPKSKNAYKVNFYYAEILYGQKHNYKEAAKQYQMVIDRHKTGEFVEDAALGLIYCYDELMVKAGLRKVANKGAKIQVVKFKKKQSNSDEKPIPKTKLMPLESKYIAAADQYVKLVSAVMKDPKRKKKHPNMGKKIPEMMFIAAQTFYKHGEFVQAVKRLQILFDYAPKSKFAAYGVFIILDCYRRLKRWNQVEKWARKLIKARNYTVKSRHELRKLVAIAMTENARQLSMERHFSGAIKKGLKVYREFRHDKKLAPKALFNVAALYEKKRDIRNAIRTYERVVREFPKSDIAPEALFTIGLINENQTKFNAAAKSFEKMKKFRKAKQTPEALIDAGLIWEALGKYKKAIRDYKNYTAWFHKKKDIPKISLHIAEVYEMMGTRKSRLSAIRTYRSWLSKKYDAPLDWRVKAYTKIGDTLYYLNRIRNRRVVIATFKNSIKAFMKVTKPKELKRGKYFAAQAAFMLAEYAFYDFQQVKIPSTLKKSVLKAALIKKAKAHKNAENMYEKVLDFKSGQWSAAAAFRIGLLYSTFANELLDLPVPEQLSPEQQEDYRALIQIQFAQPVQAKAQTAFKHALKLAHEKGAYNKYTKMCGKYAHEVNPDDFPVNGEPLVKAEHPKDTLMSTSFIRVLKRGDVIVTIKKK